MTPRSMLTVSALMGFAAVALGAFGAHGLKVVPEQNNQLANWNTAAHYHLVHAAVLLIVALIAAPLAGLIPLASLSGILIAVAIRMASPVPPIWV